MAQKAQKSQAARNTAILNRTHLISLAINLLFLLLRFTFLNRRLLPWFLCVLPSLIIEFWFERIGRPTFASNDSGQELKRAGEDLEAKGLTEWMWDVVYWTWGCTALATVIGNYGWWAYIAVPIYSAWLAFTTFSGARSGLSGMGIGAGADANSDATPSGQSKRQAKMEKRGGQKMMYR